MMTDADPTPAEHRHALIALIDEVRETLVKAGMVDVATVLEEKLIALKALHQALELLDG